AGMIGQIGTLVVGTGRLGGAATGLVLGFAALAVGTYKSIAAYTELETHQAKVTAALLITKGASGQTAVGLEEMAKRLSASGTQSVEDIRAAQIELIKFKVVGGNAFGEVLDTAKNLAASGFADLKTATGALGKGLKEVTSATEEFGAIGIKVSVSEQRLANELLATGKAAQARQLLLGVASKQAAGADAAAADTLGAAWGRVTGAGGTVLEQWGQ